MLRKTIALLASAGLLAIAGHTLAQDASQKRQNVDYYQVIHFNFKPGHNQAAWAIMYTKIGPAVRATGRDFIALDWESGPWDSSVYIRLEDGYGTLEYATTPQFSEMMAALAEAEGSEEAAQAVWDEWIGHIANTDRDIAHMHLPPDDDD